MLVTPDKVMDIKEMQGWLSLSQWVAFWCSISCQVIIPQQMKGCAKEWACAYYQLLL
jgi:hypothetical protein